jgi:hypothetical protein
MEYLTVASEGNRKTEGTFRAEIKFWISVLAAQDRKARDRFYGNCDIYTEIAPCNYPSTLTTKKS